MRGSVDDGTGEESEPGLRVPAREWPLLLRFVANHPINLHDVARPPAGTTPGVKDPLLALPILHRDPTPLFDPTAAVGAVLGTVADVALAVGVPPMVAREPQRSLWFRGNTQMG